MALFERNLGDKAYFEGSEPKKSVPLARPWIST